MSSTILTASMYDSYQQHPIKLLPTSQFETLLEGVVVSIDEAPGDTKDKPQWAQIVLNGDVSVISRHEVSMILCSLSHRLILISFKASNGVLYLIDGTFYG